MNEKPVWRVIRYIADLIEMNLLFLIFSIPVFTYGPASSALYAVHLHMTDGEPVGFHDYVSSFRSSFRQTMKGTLVLMVPAAFLLYELYRLSGMKDVPNQMYVFVLVPLACMVSLLNWVSIQGAFFECTLKQQLKNAVLLAIRSLLPSILMLLITLFPAFVFLTRSAAFFRVWPVWLFLYFSLSRSAMAFLTKKPMRALGDQLREQMNG